MTIRTVKGKWGGYMDTSKKKSATVIINGGQTPEEKKFLQDRIEKYGSKPAKGIIWPGARAITSPLFFQDQFLRFQAEYNKAKKQKQK